MFIPRHGILNHFFMKMLTDGEMGEQKVFVMLLNITNTYLFRTNFIPTFLVDIDYLPSYLEDLKIKKLMKEIFQFFLYIS